MHAFHIILSLNKMHSQSLENWLKLQDSPALMSPPTFKTADQAWIAPYSQQKN